MQNRLICLTQQCFVSLIDFDHCTDHYSISVFVGADVQQQKIIWIDWANDWHGLIGRAAFFCLARSGKVLTDRHEAQRRILNRMRQNWFVPGVNLVHKVYTWHKPVLSHSVVWHTISHCLFGYPAVSYVIVMCCTYSIFGAESRLRKY